MSRDEFALARRSALVSLARTRPRQPESFASSPENPHQELNQELWDQLIGLAETGVSLKAVARIAGIPPRRLTTWLARGEAVQEEEPYGAFTKEFLKARRKNELACAELLVTEISRLRVMQSEGQTLSPVDREFLVSHLTMTNPESFGRSTVQGRQLEEDPDAEGYLADQELTQFQLDDMLSNPSEELGNSIVRVGDQLVRYLVKRGWRAPTRLYRTIKTPLTYDEAMAGERT